jgi:hypothetical protein
MNDEQLKRLAKMTLLNTSIMATTLSFVCNALEGQYDLMAKASGITEGWPDLTPLRELADDLSSGLGDAAKDLGIDWPQA